MKKLISILLAALMLAAALASCATVAPSRSAISANIRVTSSDAEDAAAWLTERLGDALTDRVVLGTSADGYGVNVSALESDGYFIRALGDEIALFARTADGLDRAVRKYAKTVESGAAVTDVTYHEGARIKKLTVAGRDIDEYTIYCEEETHLKKGAAELSSLIERATGVTLPVSIEAPAAPYIALKYVHDEALNTCGYRWSVSADGLTLECSDLYKPTSPHFAVTRFLETRLGWTGLTFGYEALPETDLIAIEAGESGGETNAFQYACPYGDQYSGYIGDALDHSYGDHYGGFDSTHLCGIPQCCHGMSTNIFGGELSASPDHNWALDQPCYMSEDFFEASYDDISAYIEGQLAAGKVIGENFFFIDIAAGDNGNWCSCKLCNAIRKTEKSVSGSVVSWANRVTEALSEKYPGLAYGIFGYAGTNRPPETLAPNEHIYVTYCYDMSCDMHTASGVDCINNQSIPLLKSGHDNASRAAYLEGWLEKTKNVYVWFYGMDQGLLTLDYTGLMRDDLTYFNSVGVKGFFWEAEDTGFSTGKISKWLASELVWNIDMSDDEYDRCFDRIVAAMYGDGGTYVKDYCALASNLRRNSLCAHCWYSAGGTPTLKKDLIAPCFDSLFALTEAAYRNVDSKKQEMRMAKLSANCIYAGCISSYFDAYEAGNDERVAELSRRYALIAPRLAAFGLDLGSQASLFGSPAGLWEGGVITTGDAFEGDMEVMAWTSWKKNAEMLGLTVPTRKMPERVKEILAERKAEE